MVRKKAAKSKPKKLLVSPKSDPLPDENTAGNPELSFPVVAIGASAGGLAAFTALLKALPEKSGMAFVLIQHLEPKHESALTILLSKATGMPVVEVSDDLGVQPNHVYVIPPNKIMTIRKGALQLSPRPADSAMLHPIDDFCVALADEQGNRAIGVVLSGTGSDGTSGLKAIKAAGGVTFAQDPKSAQWSAMPVNAITAGSVDFVLPPKRIAAELARIGRHPYLAEAREVPEGSDLDKICLILRSATGVDFRMYKPATVRRRISRRMALHKITSLQKYIQYLRHNATEPQALADDIFIHVTSFFRDPECFQALRKRVLSKLHEKKRGARKVGEDPIRIWVAGCSTGEEVYSIAMLLLEELGEQANRTRIQIFGTDIQERALEHARTAVYSEAAVAGISAARLKRFFVCSDHGYQIQKAIRDLCVFARHDLTRDPPFSRLDLVSCRNVLIYMGQALQKRILSTFQYALKPGGYLFLGTSESVSDYSGAFTVVDAKQRIFQRKPSVTAFREVHADMETTQQSFAPLPRVATAPVGVTDFRKEAEAALLQNFTPPALVVDQDLHIVHFQGDTSPYLSPPTGQPSFHLLKMVRPELVVELRAAISKARKGGAATARDAVSFDFQGRLAMVRPEVRALPKRNGRKQDLLIVFRREEVTDAEEKTQAGRVSTVAARHVEKSARLERELSSAREHLRSLIAEHETAQEEMKAANEEILSSNEELQSTNEELETAKEELQSSNEELVTLNDELQHRNAELDVLTHDLSNLLVGVDIPVLVLDAELRVRRFTPIAGALMNLISGDIGRPFSNIASTLDVTDWKELFANVTAHGMPVEREVVDRTGHRYSMRIKPYTTDDNRIEGVLVVLLDTDLIYRARDDARRSGEYAQAIVETIQEALAVVDAESRIRSVNRSFSDLFHVVSHEMEGKSFLGSGRGQCNSPVLRERLREVFATGIEINALEIEQDFAGIGHRRLVLNARRIVSTKTVLLAIEDATERKRAREELERSESAMRALLNSISQAVITVDENGTIAMVNGNTEKLFGYTRLELVGQPTEILVPENLRETHREQHKAAFGKTQYRPMGVGLSLEARRKDGSIFPVEIGLSAIEVSGKKLAVAFLADITQRKELERAAQEHADQVQALAARLLTAQEEERRRVSRELHDQICQQLASLAIEIGGMATDSTLTEKAREMLKELQARVIHSSEATRHIAYELHPSVLDDLGLVASLEAYCKTFSEHEHVNVRFHNGELPPAIPRETASCLYRVVQESLRNIAVHSGAKRASVSLGFKKNVLELAITDDGSGFKLEEARGHGGLGLIGMEERTRLVNGKLSISARPGRGTRVHVRVPFKSGATI